MVSVMHHPTIRRIPMRSKNQRRTENNTGERPAIAHEKAEREFKQAEVSGDRTASPRDVSKIKKAKRRK
jgi:hypothetical protein